jgi:hypothetical protein
MGVIPKIMGGYVYNKSVRSVRSSTRKGRGGVSKKGGRKKKKRKTKKAGCGY